MQAVTFDSTSSREPPTRSGNSTRPVVGASGAQPADGSIPGARVELAATAVSLARAANAPSELRNGDSELRATPESIRELYSPAANVALSAEAQRLALIPAQVMDAQEIEAAREVVSQAQDALAEARAEKQRAVAEAMAPTEPREEEGQAVGVRTTVDPKGVTLPPQALSERRSPAQSDFSESAGLTAPRSPFESSTPGSTGQSLDIVVGEEAPRSGGLGTTPRAE